MPSKFLKNRLGNISDDDDLPSHKLIDKGNAIKGKLKADNIEAGNNHLNATTVSQFIKNQGFDTNHGEQLGDQDKNSKVDQIQINGTQK